MKKYLNRDNLLWFFIPFTFFILYLILKPIILTLKPFGMFLDKFPLDFPFLIVIIICIIISGLILYRSSLFNKIFINQSFQSKENDNEISIDGQKKDYNNIKQQQQVKRKNLKERKNRDYIYPLLFGSITCILIFASKNLFNDNTIIQYDYSFHYYFSWFFNKYLIPDFHSIFGFSQYFYAGHPLVAFYPPGAYIIQYILTFLGLNINMSMRILIGISIIGFFFIPYQIFKSNNESLTVLIISLIALLGINDWLKFIEYGQYPFLLSVILCFFLISNYNSHLKKNRLNLLSGNSKYKHILLIYLITLIHFTSIIVFFLYICLNFLREWFIDKKNFKFLKSEINLILLYGIFAIMAYSLYFIPNFFITRQYFISNATLANSGNFRDLIFYSSSGLLVNFLFSFPGFFLYLIIIGILNPKIQIIDNQKKIDADINISITDKKNSNKKIIFKNKWKEIINGKYFQYILFLLALIIIIFLDIIISKLGFPLINAIGLMRLLAFTSPILAIFVGKFFDSLFHQIRLSLIQKNSTLKTPKINSKYFKINSKKSYILILIIFIVISAYMFYGFLYPYSNDESSTNNINWSWDNFSQRHIENYTKLPANVSEVYNWIGARTSNNYRILLEESGLFSNFKWDGYSESILPALYNTSLIGGYFQIYGVFYNNTFRSTSYEGTLFGIAVNGNTSASICLNQLNSFNIKYLIGWSDDMVGFLQNNPNTFKYITHFDGFYIYEYKNWVNSYVLSSNPGIKITNLTMNQTEIKFNANNCSINDTIQVSVQNYYNWKIFINGTQIKADPISSLITIRIPENANFSIDIIWKQSIYSILGTYIFIGGIFLAIFGFIYESMKKKFRTFKSKMRSNYN